GGSSSVRPATSPACSRSSAPTRPSRSSPSSMRRSTTSRATRAEAPSLGPPSPPLMATLRRMPEGLNQPPPLAGRDLFRENRPLAEALEREGAGWAHEQAAAFGRVLGGEPAEWARLANEN